MFTVLVEAMMYCILHAGVTACNSVNSVSQPICEPRAHGARQLAFNCSSKLKGDDWCSRSGQPTCRNCDNLDFKLYTHLQVSYAYSVFPYIYRCTNIWRAFALKETSLIHVRSQQDFPVACWYSSTCVRML